MTVSDGRLAGKVALITGTAGGQGRAAALLFARHGARVVGCDVKTEEAAETVELVTAAGGTMHSVQPLDLSDPAAARSVVERAVGEFGRIDVVYNNAGRPEFAPVEHMSDEQWRWTIANELDSVFYVCRAAWPHLAQRGGSVINTASLNAQRVVPGLPAVAHTAAKSGVMALTRQLAIEGGPLGIRANSISPGIIRTPATEPMLQASPEFAEMAHRSVLLNRLGEPEDVANMALFLASDESAWVTGADFLVDGGGAIF